MLVRMGAGNVSSPHVVLWALFFGLRLSSLDYEAFADSIISLFLQSPTVFPDAEVTCLAL